MLLGQSEEESQAGDVERAADVEAVGRLAGDDDRFRFAHHVVALGSCDGRASLAGVDDEWRVLQLEEHVAPDGDVIKFPAQSDPNCVRVVSNDVAEEGLAGV